MTNNATNKSTALLAALAMAFTVSAAHAANAAHEEKALSDAKVTLKQAVAMAEQQGNGPAISAEYEPQKGAAGHYEIKVLSSDGAKLVKYRLSPATGKVTEADNQPFEKVFTRIKPTSIQNAPTSLKSAITTAEAQSGGKAVDASVDRDGDQVKYSVKVAKADGTTEKIQVNGADGKVASAK
jgi:uncharacterized membrane protein YkoI